MWYLFNILSLFNDLFIIKLLILIENIEITKKQQQTNRKQNTWKCHQNLVILNWLNILQICKNDIVRVKPTPQTNLIYVGILVFLLSFMLAIQHTIHDHIILFYIRRIGSLAKKEFPEQLNLAN